MLATLQLLAAELQEEKSADLQKGRKVSVIMPSFYRKEEVVEERIYAPKMAEIIVEAKPEKIEQPAAVSPVPEIPKVKQSWMFDPIKEIPTLSHQPKAGVELNEIIGVNKESLNEKLKTASVELGTVLQSSPVRDLKKAIGINDRYVFVNELFRGDEVMYERSIKTINTFTILPEAEYWIKRELKLKLAWHEESDTVKHFDQLVRRRFS